MQHTDEFFKFDIIEQLQFPLGIMDQRLLLGIAEQIAQSTSVAANFRQELAFAFLCMPVPFSLQISFLLGEELLDVTFHKPFPLEIELRHLTGLV